MFQQTLKKWIYSVLGQKVFVKKLNNNKSVYLNMLQTGVYIVNIHNEKGNQTYKFIKN